MTTAAAQYDRTAASTEEQHTSPRNWLLACGVLAIIELSYVSAVVANQPTPWIGAIERASQYVTNLWYAVLAVVLLRQQRRARAKGPAFGP